MNLPRLKQKAWARPYAAKFKEYWIFIFFVPIWSLQFGVLRLSLNLYIIYILDKSWALWLVDAVHEGYNVGALIGQNKRPGWRQDT